MRLTMGRQVVAMWHALKEKKGNFIPEFIGSVLQMTLLKQKGTKLLLSKNRLITVYWNRLLWWIHCVDHCAARRDSSCYCATKMDTLCTGVD